jgi:hypothetical protein
MGSNGKWSHLSCVTAPNGDIAFTGSFLRSDDVTVSVNGAVHPRQKYGRYEGQWAFGDHQGVILSGTMDGKVESRHDFDPEAILGVTETMVPRAAKVCQSRQNKLNFRPAKMDFNLF